MSDIKCEYSGAVKVEICQECKKGVLVFNYYNEFIEAEIFSCDYCLKDYIKNNIEGCNYEAK